MTHKGQTTVGVPETRAGGSLTAASSRTRPGRPGRQATGAAAGTLYAWIGLPGAGGGAPVRCDRARSDRRVLVLQLGPGTERARA